MTNTPSSKRSYLLTEQGKAKLDAVIQKIYGFRQGYKGKLATKASLDRNTVSKILIGQKGVAFQSLDNLFLALDLILLEEDYQELERETSSLPQTNFVKAQSPVNTKLRDALTELNYLEQEYRFRTSLETIERVGSFLLHGKPGYGQRWLANRLASKVAFNVNAYQKPYNIKRPKDINTLWQEFGQLLGCDATPQAMVQKVYGHWKTQTVILTLHNIDRIAGECLKQFMQEFWQELVKEVLAYPQDSEFPLLLFLVDHKGCNCQLGISVVDRPDNNHPHIPVDLSEIQHFSDAEIRRWCGASLVNLLSEINQNQIKDIELIIQDILGRNSQPIHALSAICENCDLDWFTDIEGEFKL